MPRSCSRCATTWSASHDLCEFTPLAYASNDDGDVMVFLRYAFTITATGKHVEMNMHHYWKFRDQKVCYVRSSEDTAQIAAALTL